ncbi:hypothetical protein HCJ12_14035 [Listeria welshimeri]|nr:hypothetical protein [Listeria welshimeri]MBC1639915.1 hypothetical protein [Listeria welshimeri]MBC1670573.1 hypothetical protein [Listeria welshimeri]
MKLNLEIENMKGLISKIEEEAKDLVKFDLSCEIAEMEKGVIDGVNSLEFSIGSGFYIMEAVNPANQLFGYYFEIKEFNKETSVVVVEYKENEAA